MRQGWRPPTLKAGPVSALKGRRLPADLESKTEIPVYTSPCVELSELASLHQSPGLSVACSSKCKHAPTYQRKYTAAAFRHFDSGRSVDVHGNADLSGEVRPGQRHSPAGEFNARRGARAGCIGAEM
jgi:hypothetical protein